MRMSQNCRGTGEPWQHTRHSPEGGPVWVPRRNNRESEPIEGDVATIGTVLNLWNFGVNNGAAVTVLGDMNNSGGIDLENAAALTVNGNLQNSGNMTTSFFG